MSKISVLIPTIQKNTRVLYKLLKVLCSDKAVDEILIINNALKEFEEIVQDKKIKIYTPSENLYVNAAWNLGIKLLKNEKFLIINDDILCCENFCSKILESKILDEDSTGLVGLDGSYINQNDRKTVTDISVPQEDEQGELRYIAMPNHMMTGDWGSAFLGKKENYYDIPDIFKIIYGDNYLLHENKKHGKTNYKIAGLRFNHIHSLSSGDPEFTKVVVSDIRNSKQFFV